LEDNNGFTTITQRRKWLKENPLAPRTMTDEFLETENEAPIDNFYIETYKNLQTVTDEEIGRAFIDGFKKRLKTGILTSSKIGWRLIKGIAIILGIIVALIEISKYRQEQSSEKGKSTSREYYPKNN